MNVPLPNGRSETHGPGLETPSMDTRCSLPFYWDRLLPTSPTPVLPHPNFCPCTHTSGVDHYL